MTQNPTSTAPRRGLSRRRFLQFGALGVGVTLTGFGGSLAWASQAVRAFENETVIPLTPWLVNTYLVRGERPILVDTGFPSDEPAIRAALDAQGIALTDLALIFITHAHGDHFGSAAAFKASSSAPVSIHPLEAERLASGTSGHVEALSTTGRIISLLPMTAQTLTAVEPEVLLEDGQTLNGYGLAARVIHTPGHTDGSVSLLIEDIAIIGDLMAGSLLYPDQPDYPFFIEDPADQPQILTSLRRLLDEDAQTFYPGHGLPFSRAAAERWIQTQ